jgi:cytochrome c oxidase subunit 4
MSEHVASIRSNVYVFVALIALLFATVGGAYLPVAPFHLVLAMTIAVAKALLVVLFFMHVLHGNRLTWVFSSAAFIWLGIMIALSLSDYHSRGWLQIPGK